MHLTFLPFDLAEATLALPFEIPRSPPPYHFFRRRHTLLRLHLARCLPRIGAVGHIPLASELLDAEKRFLFVVVGGGEDGRFLEVGLVGEKFAAVAVEVEVGRKGLRKWRRRFGEKKKRGSWDSLGEVGGKESGE